MRPLSRKIRIFPSKEKLVYIISNPAWPNWFKVGIASNYKKRRDNYQTGSPFRDYKLEFGITTPDWKSVEKIMHSSFPGSHEWVEGDLDEIKLKLKKLCKM